MRKQFLTIFLLLVLAIQALPVKQMGMALFSNQFTEEIPHGMDMEKDCCKKGDCKSDFLATGPIVLDPSFIDIFFDHHQLTVSIPHNHAGDIHVPPPNC